MLNLYYGINAVLGDETIHGNDIVLALESHGLRRETLEQQADSKNLANKSFSFSLNLLTNEGISKLDSAGQLYNLIKF